MSTTTTDNPDRLLNAAQVAEIPVKREASDAEIVLREVGKGTSPQVTQDHAAVPRRFRMSALRPKTALRFTRMMKQKNHKPVLRKLHNGVQHSFITADVAGARCGVSPARLLDLCEAGYAPHYQMDGGDIKFRSSEIQEWVIANLLQVNAGMPLPRVAAVAMDANEGALIALSPKCLRGIEGLQLCPMPPKWWGIYFLCEGSKLVYVGQSVDIFTRVCTHKTTKKFDAVFWLPVPPTELDRMEGAFIRLLKPCLNGNPGPVPDDDAMESAKRMLVWSELRQ
jgi:hypothetical protein